MADLTADTPTPRTDEMDYNTPDTEGNDDWRAAYLRMLNHARTLERALAESERKQCERCVACNAELSQCGPLDTDGEPSLDCKECQLREMAEELVQRAESAEAKLAQARQDALEEAARVCDKRSADAKKIWDDYIAACNADPKNIGSGSQSWHQYFESCASDIRALASTNDSARPKQATSVAKYPHDFPHTVTKDLMQQVAAWLSEYKFDEGITKTKWEAFDHILNVEVTMKPVPQDKSHCFKHACTFPLHEGECPYCKIERLQREAPISARPKEDSNAKR